MDVKKEGKYEKLLSTVKKLLSSPTVLHPAKYPASFFGAFLLSRGIILGTTAPLGLSFCAALGATRFAIPSLLGAAFGYLTVLDDINSLKYIACAILIFTAHFVFSGTSLIKHRSFSPLAVLIPFLCINFVFVADAGFALYDTALSVFEASLATFFTILLAPLTATPARTKPLAIALLALGAALAAALYSFSPFGAFSFGCSLSFLAVLLGAASGGLSAGVLFGMIFGIMLSLASSSPELCVVYGVFGICASLNINRGRVAAVLTASLCALFLSVCFNPSSLVSTSLELLFASALFFPLANTFSRYTRRFFITEGSRRDTHIRAYTSEKLGFAASAFGSLGTLLSETKHRNTQNEQTDITAMFTRATKELCRSCKLSSICWERDYEATRDCLTNAGNAIRKNGTLSAKDFPMYFSSRCLHIEELINTVNREIFSVRYRKQYDGRLRESHELLTKQYADVSEIFSALSSDISDTARFDEVAETDIRDTLACRGILCETAVYRDFRGHLNIHLCGKDLTPVIAEKEKFVSLFSDSVGARLSEPQYSHTESLDDILIREAPPLRAMFGAAVKRRGSSEASGDSGSFFYPVNGVAALLLSDGMGSGKLAACESATSIRLLEGLLKSGISPQNALKTLQTALALKAEYSGSFATLDLAYIDLFSGVCDIYKFGGAPTYIKRQNKLRRITASSLPAGMSFGRLSPPDKTTLTLIPGDFVVMISDGICDEQDDARLLEFLSKTDVPTAKALADAVVAFSLATYSKNDDMTVAVLHISADE